MHAVFDELGQHLLLFLSIVGALIVIRKYLREQAEHRNRLMLDQYEQIQLLKRIDHELHPDGNGGTSMADRVENIERSVNSHHEDAAVYFKENEEAHQHIHRRIDGLFEILGGTNQPRMIAERHRQMREDSDG